MLAARTEISVGIGDALVTQTGLSYGTPYCYKVFWTDSTGNVVSAYGGYDGVAPAAGSISISGFDTKTIKFTHTPPNDSHYLRLIVRRFDTATCSTKTQLEGTEVAMAKAATTYSDAGLNLGTPYCYRVFWSDTFGNSIGTTVNYDGDGPGAANFSISGYATKTINLAWTNSSGTATNVPTAAGFSSVEIYRHEAATCADKAQGDGTKLPLTANATSFSDNGDPDGAGPLTGTLALNKAYCYKIFWLDGFGNSSSATTAYAGVGPSGGDLQLVAMKASNIDVKIIRPSPAPASTQLERYSGASCTGAATALSNLGTITAAVTYSDATVSTGRTYCYKSTWADAFGNTSSATTLAVYFPPTYSLSPLTLTLPTNGSGSVFTYTANFSGSSGTYFSGKSAIMLPIMASDIGSSTANGAVGISDSDIPGLVYEKVTNGGSCTASSAPLLCASQATGTVTGSNYSLPAPGTLSWSYSKFDQGDYDLNTATSLQADSLKYFSTARKISITTQNLGDEEVGFAGTTSITENFSDVATWFKYPPSIAVADGASTSTKQIYAVTYSALHQDKNRYINTFSVDRTSSNTPSFTSDFSNSNSDLANHQVVSTSSAESEYTALAASAASTSTTAEWLALSSVSNGSQNYLALSIANSSGTFARQTINLSNNSALVSLASTAITPTFTDDDGKQRHGIAFSSDNGSNYGVYVSKILSNVDSAPLARGSFLDRSGYFQSSNGLGTAMPEAVTIDPNSPSQPNSIKMVTRNESGTNVFYVGWRASNLAGTDEVAYFSKLKADGNNTPSVYPTLDTDVIPGMTRTTEWGRSSFAIAAGTSNNTTPTDILGVLYSDDTGSPSCKFRAYKFDSASSKLKRVSTATDPVLDSGTTTDCRFVNLFWNPTAKKFLAVWAQGGASNFGTTNYAEFTYNADLYAIEDYKKVIVTSSRTGNTKVCTMGANYVPVSSGSNLPRIAIVTVESTDCGNSTSADLKVDFYKPSR